MNQVTLIGRLGRDPELKESSTGLAICSFSIATDEYSKSKGKFTEWHKLVAFGGTAESVAKYLSKGSQVGVIGSLSTSSWEDKTHGDMRYSTSILVNKIDFLSGRSESSTEPLDPSDEEIPF